MRLTQTSLIVAAGFGAVWIAAMASCADEDPDNLLTTNATQMQTTTGMGGTSTNGGGGAGADGGESSTGGTTSTGGQGGQGGDPEPVINGCTSATATDATLSASPINVNLPGGPYCLRVAANATVTFTLPSVGASRYLGGTYIDATGTKAADAGSPIYSCDNASPFTTCPVINNMACSPANPPGCRPPFSFPLVGVYPWYDDFAPGTIRGVIYVE